MKITKIIYNLKNNLGYKATIFNNYNQDIKYSDHSYCIKTINFILFQMKSNNKKYSIGSWITLDNIAIVEIMAQSGFDWLCIDLEHTVIDYKELQNLIAISSYNNITSL